MNKFKVKKELQERNWGVSDIVLMDERSAEKVSDYIEPYGGDELHKHTAITVDPIRLSAFNFN